jgi:hypothetical protein
VIGTENVGIGAYCGTDCRREDGPPILLLRPFHCLCFHDDALALLLLEQLRFGGSPAVWALLSLGARLEARAAGMRAPALGATPAPAVSLAFIVGNRRLGIGRTGTMLRCTRLDMRRHSPGCLGLGRGRRCGLLLGQWLRACLKRSRSGCETPHHRVDQGDSDPRLAGCRQGSRGPILPRRLLFRQALNLFKHGL